jgi:hypothetical protein
VVPQLTQFLMEMLHIEGAVSEGYERHFRQKSDDKKKDMIMNRIYFNDYLTQKHAFSDFSLFSNLTSF